MNTISEGHTTDINMDSTADINGTETFKIQKQKMHRSSSWSSRSRTTSFPGIVRPGPARSSRASSYSSRPKPENVTVEEDGDEEVEDTSRMTAVEVVEEHFRRMRRDFYHKQEQKRAQFMEEQLREAAEFEAQQSRLKLKHVRTLQSIMATRTWRKEEEVRVERNRKLSKVDEEDEEEVGRSDMMDSDEGNTERIVSTVISDLECPGCNKVMRPPVHIWRCDAGHLICDPCRQQLLYSACPSCSTETRSSAVGPRSGLIVGRAVNVERIARSLFSAQST